MRNKCNFQFLPQLFLWVRYLFQVLCYYILFISKLLFCVLIIINILDLAKDNFMLQFVSKLPAAGSSGSIAVVSDTKSSTDKNSATNNKCTGPDDNLTLDESCETNTFSYRKHPHKRNNLHVKHQHSNETPYEISPVFVSSLQCEHALKNLVQLKASQENELTQLQLAASINSHEYFENKQKISAMRERLASLKEVAEQEEILLKIFKGDKLKAASFSQEASMLALTSIIRRFETADVNVKGEVIRLLG